MMAGRGFSIGLAFYFAYGWRYSHVARGTEVPDVKLPGPIKD